ncbi:MAG: hypothetical protein CL946_07630 [Ectothiorhodospiraceae bacterium]|nr:hypothetical protein [Ectothiorhodospiraceae bacterium]
MIRFEHPEYLYYLFALIPIAGLFWLVWFWKARSVVKFGNARTLRRLIAERSGVKFWLRAGILLFAFGVLIVGFANPKIGTKYEEVTRTGIDLIVAIDVSNSMNAEDILPNRISAAKRELGNLINNLKGDRIGIIVFAGSGYTQLPLTSDYSAAMLLSDVIYTGVAPKAGTSISSAISLAMESFEEESGKHKAMIIITDGENHEDDPVSAAEEAGDAGIVVHTIGMGSVEGAPIPIKRNGRLAGYKKDQQGNTVISKLDEETLREVAAAAGGTYTRASNAQDNLAEVFGEIEKMEQKDFGTKEFTDHEDRFQYLLGLGIILLILEVMMSERRNRFFARFSLFAPREEDTTA